MHIHGRAEMLLTWMAVGVASGLASFAVIGVLAYFVVMRQLSRHQAPPMTSPESLTTDVDDERPSGTDSDAESCSPAQDIAVSQSTPDLIGRDAAHGYLATGRAPDVN